MLSASLNKTFPSFLPAAEFFNQVELHVLPISDVAHVMNGVTSLVERFATGLSAKCSLKRVSSVRPILLK